MTIQIGLMAGIITGCGRLSGLHVGFLRGAYDRIVRWAVDVLLTVPGLLLLVVIASALGDRLLPWQVWG